MDNASSDKRRMGLGRGLSALIPPKPEAAAVGAVARGVQELPIEEILPGDAQPRQNFAESALEELAASIRLHGVIQPIIVRRRGAHQYEIVAGERRWRAAQRAGLKQIPAVVSDIAEKTALTIALVENVQREDLNAIEEAEAYQRLQKELGHSQQEIADAVGKDRVTVANSLRLLKLPSSVRKLVLDGELSMGHARALLALENASEMEQTAREAIAKKWSVRQVEKATSPSSKSASAAKKTESAAERDVRQRLQQALGTKVDVKHNNGKGTLTVHFSSYAELEAIMTKMRA